MTTTKTPQEDDVKAIRDALALGPTPGPWGLGNADGFAAIVRNEAGDIITPTGPRTADATYIAACYPERIARLLAHIDAQAVLLVDAERLAAARLEQMQADRKQALVWRDQAELYEQVRKFSPREFQALWTKNVTSGAMFDDLVRAAIASEAKT